MRRVSRVAWAVVVAGLGSAGGVAAQNPAKAVDSVAAPAAGSPGRIAGQVVDRANGKPLSSVQILVVDRSGIAESDLDGRFRIPDLPAGTYRLRVRLIGYRAIRQDSVVVTAGKTTLLSLALTSAPVELEELVVQSAPSQQAASEAGLLAIQQAAPTVMDGISAETMQKSPDSDAGEAIARVTGVSVVDDKYMVIRGLGDRYGNTLLNGTELPSPEPTRRVVPLDLFPASLLESIVTTKAGRPDRPGDYTGALVEIQTKEFPENRVLQLTASQEYNSLATFERVLRGPRGGSDRLGFDGQARRPSLAFPVDGQESTPAGERFAESIRNVWAPSGRAPLNLGLGLNAGGLLLGGNNPLGGVFALNYSAKTEHIPERLYQLANAAAAGGDASLGAIYRQTATVVDWGAIVNFTQRLGGSSKLSLKNLYSRNSEETFFGFTAFNTDNDAVRTTRGYQARFIERELFQSQLGGEHRLSGLLGSRFEWKASVAQATRDEPENRNLRYFLNPDGSEVFLPSQAPHYFFYRFLDDRILSGQGDWAIPFSFRGRDDSELKIGTLYRKKRRNFDAQNYRFTVAPAYADDTELLRLRPEELFTPENLGTSLNYVSIVFGEVGPIYELTDEVAAGYAMVDFPFFPGVRLVGGLRVEDWRLVLTPELRGQPQLERVVYRKQTDPLWSANLTIALSDRSNLRFASYRSVARPEGRELSAAYYEPIGGECGVIGNPELRRTSVVNADARWELYPSPGELISIGGFYKQFTDPIFEQISFTSINNCEFHYFNGTAARNLGMEFEIRKGLGFLAPALGNFSVGANFTYVDTESESRIESGPNVAVLRRQFVGQSPYVVNASVSYDDPEGGLRGTILFNYFDDRIQRYGGVTFTDTEFVQVPDVVEVGRATLDAKISKRLGQLSLALSGKNLTNAPTRFVQETGSTRVTTGAYETGVSFVLGVGYDF